MKRIVVTYSNGITSKFMWEDYMKIVISLFEYDAKICNKAQEIASIYPGVNTIERAIDEHLKNIDLEDVMFRIMVHKPSDLNCQIFDFDGTKVVHNVVQYEIMGR